MFSEYMIICIFYILGIILSKTFDMSCVLFLSITLFFVAIVRSIINKCPKWSLLLLSLVVLFGSVRYFEASQNRLYSEFPDKYVTVEGIIYSQAASTDSEYANRYILKLSSVSYIDKTVKTNTRIVLYTKDSFPFGAEVTARGFLNEIEGINNEHEFDFVTYYMGKGISARLTACDISQTGMAFSLSPEFLMGKYNYRLSHQIDDNFSQSSAPFLKAIVTGDKRGFSDEYLDLLLKTGIYRILYTPLIHISLIFFIANIFPFSIKNRHRIVIVLVMLYALSNSTSPTILKAAILCGIFLYKRHTSGFANKMDLLSKLVLVMTIFEPLLCFNSGFFMSVTSTVLVYLSYKPLYMRFLRYFTRRKWKFKSFLSNTLTLWAIFVMGTMPISAYLFGGMSVYAVIFTIIATPVIMLTIVLSPVMLLMLEIFGKSPVLVYILDKLMGIVAIMPQVVKQLPSYFIALRTPKIAEIILFYLFWWIFLRALTSKLKTTKTAVILAVALGVSVSALPSYEFNTLSVNFVNVGQGDGAVLHTSRGETVLIDGGGAATYESGYNIGERVFLPYLNSHGFSDIDVAIATHFHKDHIEGIIAAAENLKINTIVMPNTDPDNPYRKQLCEISEDKKIRTEFLACDDEIIFDSGLKIKFIAPDKPQLESDEANDTSLVAHVTYGEFSALFTGDSTDMISDAYPKDIDLLKVAHHGSKNQTQNDYLEHTSPKYAVISVGKNNSYNLPSDDVLLRLKEKDVKVLRTDKMGDIQFKVKKNGYITYKTLKGE